MCAVIGLFRTVSSLLPAQRTLSATDVPAPPGMNKVSPQKPICAPAKTRC
jgi:hypothetical protein